MNPYTRTEPFIRPRAFTANVSCRSHTNSSLHKFLQSHFERHCFLLKDEVDISQRAYRRSALTESYGLQGRPRIIVTQQQLQTLHEVCGFCWNDIAETLGVSDRTLRRRLHEYGMRVEGREFSSLKLQIFPVSFVSQFPKETWIQRKQHQI